METWIWISLWIVQTIVGAVLWRKYKNGEGMIGETPQSALIFSSMVILNIVGCCVLLCKFIHYPFGILCKFVDYLSGVKNKTEEK